MSWRSIMLVTVASMVLLLVNSVESYASMEQLTKSGDMMRSVCMNKAKPSLEHVEGLPSGKFPESKEIMCYANCVLELMQGMRRGKIVADSAMKQADLLIPPEYAEPTKRAFDTCRHAGDGVKNNCEVAYALLKCLHKNNPKFFFP
ncbi:general odorant-binding protein 72 [Culex quinquefasciatus]|nr:general odorant-binding protein 72 [Culex quinquefasciatus]